MQRVLLRLEAARGRPPAHSAERGAARHLYERYRAVKRALATSRPDAVSKNISLLVFQSVGGEWCSDGCNALIVDYFWLTEFIFNQNF